MCAIYGYLGFEDSGLLDRMDRILIHRGPDGSGQFEANGIAMGMRRLSIIDIQGGGQPCTNENEQLVLCYNGELYNYIELRDELIAKGHQFRSESDTEVIVHAYEEWGDECLQRFNGMFAFCLFDRETKTIFLARDRCGQKPLYLWNQGAKVIFASEIKAILTSKMVARKCRLASIDAYLAIRYVPEPYTMFEGIETLPAGHFLKFTLGDSPPAPKRYWEVGLVPPEEQMKEDECLDALEHLFHDSVRLTMRSDVPVGAYLSAGVDSSLIVASMRRFSDQVSTFSIGFNSPIDETHDAAETARLLGTQHHEIHCTPEDFDLLPKVIWHMDRPVGDALIIAFFKMAEAASKKVKVVLGGEGADEMYAGYSFHKMIQLVESWHQSVPAALHDHIALPALKMTPPALLDRFFQFPAGLGERGKSTLVDFLGNYRQRGLFENYVSLRTLMSASERQALYAPECKKLASTAWIPEAESSLDSAFLDRLLKLQYREWLQDWAIIRQDKNTMAHSLEIRMPFLDHRLIEQAFRMPASVKVHRMRDKWIERQLAAKMLPPQVSNRPKNPFFFPMEFFYEHPQVKSWISETLSPEKIKSRGIFDPDAVAALIQKMETREFIYLKQVMSLVILELWHQIFIDGKDFHQT